MRGLAKSVLGLVLASGAAPVCAAVISSSSNGFHVRHVAALTVPPEAAFAAFGRVSGWWHPAHSYSGASTNMSLALTPGGCFCERLPHGGGIEHLHVNFVEPGRRVVLTGSLGPLLFEATAGVMDVTVERVAGGSRLSLDYRAAGFADGGANTLAGPVDAMLGAQIKRFRAYAAAQPRTN